MWSQNGGKNFKGQSWWIDQKGYVVGFVWIDDKRKHVKRHRYLMELHLGRELLLSEDVHHINGDKRDNRIENLQVITHSAHSVITNRNRNYSRGKKLNLSDSERRARSERMSAMRRAAIAKATGGIMTAPIDMAAVKELRDMEGGS